MGQHARLVFDHEEDSPARRQVADWGGDEVFARTPRKRVARRVGIGETGLAAAGRSDVPAGHDSARPHVSEPVRPRLHVVSTEPAEVLEGASEEFDVIVEPSLAAAREDESAAGPESADDLAPAAEEFVSARDEERAPNGRRTVLITGRPGAHPAPAHSPADRTRRRPGRTMDERLGARPDRVAAWACALGVTLILTAVATADAAPL